MTPQYQVWLGVLAFASLTQVSAAQSPDRAILQSVQTTVQGDLTIVTIAADGPLPQPLSGEPDAPPRIFLDFTGVTPKAWEKTAVAGSSAVKQVRVALHSTAPNVTRVVLDLTRRETFRIDADERQSGRIRILVGSPSAVMPVAAASPGPTLPKPVGAPPAPPAPAAAASPSPLPAPAAPAGSGLTTGAGSGLAIPSPTPTPPKPVVAPPAPSAPAAAASPSPAPAAPAGSGLTTGAGSGPAIRSQTPTPPSPARRGPPVSEATPNARLPMSEIENYRRQLAGALERLESRRAVVAAIDLDQRVAAEILVATAADFRVLRRILEGTKPSAVLRPAHDLLIASCELGARAASLRSDADRSEDLQVRRNAASAAAGALMLFDRACAALGCATIGR